MLRLRRLTILKFRQLSVRQPIRFSDGLNVLLGTNASGKTTLLELIAAALRGDFGPFRNEPFELRYVLFDEESRLEMRVLVKNETSAASSAGLPVDEAAKAVASSLVTHQFSARVTLVLPRSDSGAKRIVYRTILADNTLKFFRGREKVSEEKASPPRFFLIASCIVIGRALEQPAQDQVVGLGFSALWNLRANLRRFDEGLETYKSLLGTDPNDPKSVQLTLTIKPDGSVHAFDEFLPEALLEAAQDSVRQVADDPSSLTFASGRLPFLKAACELMGFTSATMGLNLIERRESEDKSVTIRYGNFRFAFTQQDASIISHDRLSYGQKRLLAFLYTLHAATQVLVADELVNGLHHGWIDACLKEVGDRQVFLTSQNPLLLDHIGFSSARDVAHKFIVCRRTFHDRRLAYSWGNMSSRDAQTFYDAYSIGIQHVGDILRTKGLW